MTPPSLLGDGPRTSVGTGTARPLRIGLFAILLLVGLVSLATATVAGASGPSSEPVATPNDWSEPGSAPAARPDGEYEDSDRDGLSDHMERVLGTDPTDADTDGDHITDGREVSVYGTDPLSIDTDGDGIADNRERNMGLDPTSVDTDGDSLSDARELELGTSPQLRDTDRDGLSDDLEVLIGTEAAPGAADSDPVESNGLTAMTGLGMALPLPATTSIVVLTGAGIITVGLWYLWRWYQRFTSPVVVKTEQ